MLVASVMMIFHAGDDGRLFHGGGISLRASVVKVDDADDGEGPFPHACGDDG